MTGTVHSRLTLDLCITLTKQVPEVWARFGWRLGQGARFGEGGLVMLEEVWERFGGGLGKVLGKIWGRFGGGLVEEEVWSWRRFGQGLGKVWRRFGGGLE